jgi:hypothetical protein
MNFDFAPCLSIKTRHFKKYIIYIIHIVDTAIFDLYNYVTQFKQSQKPPTGDIQEKNLLAVIGYQVIGYE